MATSVENKEVIESQLELIRDYYNTIGFQKNITVNDIMVMIKKDIEYLEQQLVVHEANKIIKKR